MKKRIVSTLGLVFVMLSFVLAGCVGNRSEEGLARISAEEELLSDSGTLTLKVNPEIAVKYNKEGMVTDVVGNNADGEEIIDHYTDFIGKESGLALEELIALINEAGYFVEETEGQSKQFILELEAGSILPDEQFLENMTTNIQNAVANLNVKPDVVTEAGISLEEAKKIALDDASVKAEDLHFEDQELDQDDGIELYELEFYIDGYEYEYDIHAVSGEILKAEHDIKQGKQTNNEASNETTKISKDEAIDIALNHAGLTRSQVIFDDVELDNDHGRLIWEVEFVSENWEYEYDIDALTKNILDFEKEYDD